MVDYKAFFEEVKHNPHDKWINEHLDTIYNITKSVNAQSVIELGVQTGQSTSAFLYALSETGGRLWSCDINPLWGRIKDVTAPFWTFTQGDDLKLVNDAPWADIIFIDTSHDYKQTSSELIDYYANCLNEGGLFILHDTYNLECLGVFGAAISFAEQYGFHFYNYHYCAGLGILGRDLSKVSHLFNSRGYKWL